ncbi:transcription factor TFIIIB component B'' homolog [Toxorhynchites rutilus septentrionalis]|uniref:transcription factor TFIIIB component B'' homolog n=1 Tax=Toxorhynchites rutilus septentrionalis TaxID=329112 RepID=UPI00247A7562|nr:transcription factor TFIIIB component B'' homolog [Toxorhynchites rutilus septentrionalis]XP_055644753.1 transcription factor TFIIIB component B'' homolog [Toxorhynchites rutilus septentrionalis]XP_055644754.1 transcription factor TFIIIB component B'' homolog [Toxorhynchites rutilus septentrionalis]
MATRRPRVKVAANLSIRRPPKQTNCESTETKLEKTESVSTKEERKAEDPSELIEDKKYNNLGSKDVNREDGKDTKVKIDILKKHESNVCEDQSTFKSPRPVEEPAKVMTPAPIQQSLPVVCTEEPLSPRKIDSKFAYLNTINSSRKRIRTESMTSNKSYSEVSLKSRKTIKQEESQKASDAKRDLRKRLNNIQNVDKQSLTMFDMIYYNPVKNPMKNPTLTNKKGSLENIPNTVDRDSHSVSKSRSPTPAPTIPPPPDPPKPLVQLTPQLKLGPNGEMILDETSLVVENEREREIRDTMAKQEIVYDDEFSGNSGYYSRYKRTKDWPPEETIRFYRCLHTIGTDFSMMIQLFPNRSRRDLKLKFKKEERLNLMLVNKALLYPKEFNIEVLKSQFQEEDEQIERQREVERQMKLEAKEKLKLEKSAKKLQINQSKNRNPKKRVSRAARVMLDGERINKTEPLLKDPKPKSRKRKTFDKESLEKQEIIKLTDSTAIESPHAVDEDSVDVESFPNDEHHSGESDIGDSLSEVRKTDVEDIRYVPNVMFKEFEAPEAPASVELNESSHTNSDSVPTVEIPSEPPLDIEAMDIDIVDEESKSVYEIKAELKNQNVLLHEVHQNVPEITNVITLQNLDDQTQTTVTYQEPDVVDSSDMVDNCPDVELEAIESKYYGGCDAVYIPMPTNAPIAHPVKADMYTRKPCPTIATPPPSAINDSHSVICVDALENAEITQNEAATLNADPNPVSTQDRPVKVQPEPKVEFKPEPEKAITNPATEDISTASSSSVCKEEHNPPDDRQQESGETEVEPRGLGLLEAIDINSLVLVESQDTTDPEKTIYEIYVINPKTGKLSEKPLDVPEDVIENIRSILEVGD